MPEISFQPKSPMSSHTRSPVGFEQKPLINSKKHHINSMTFSPSKTGIQSSSKIAIPSPNKQDLSLKYDSRSPVSRHADREFRYSSTLNGRHTPTVESPYSHRNVSLCIPRENLTNLQVIHVIL